MEHRASLLQSAGMCVQLGDPGLPYTDAPSSTEIGKLG